MGNILRAVRNIVENPITSIKSFYEGRNRANGVGDALENYIVDVFANTIHLNEGLGKMERHDEVFSYRGNQNNPPDLMIRAGDAIETKKIQGNGASIQLNSSYPKSKLHSDSSMLTPACVKCEDWTVKDIIYAIGNTTDTDIKYLWLVYGDCFVADRAIYKKIKTTIAAGITSIPDVEFAQTNELGRVNRVDPLGITSLRIRGMWTILNPHKLFGYLKCCDDKAKFQLICLMRVEKFNSFSEEDKNALLGLTKENYSIENVKIQNPDNPAQLLDAKLITFRIYN